MSKIERFKVQLHPIHKPVEVVLGSEYDEALAALTGQTELLEQAWIERDRVTRERDEYRACLENVRSDLCWALDRNELPMVLTECLKVVAELLNAKHEVKL